MVLTVVITEKYCKLYLGCYAVIVLIVNCNDGHVQLCVYILNAWLLLKFKCFSTAGDVKVNVFDITLLNSSLKFVVTS